MADKMAARILKWQLMKSCMQWNHDFRVWVNIFEVNKYDEANVIQVALHENQNGGQNGVHILELAISGVLYVII